MMRSQIQALLAQRDAAAERTRLLARWNSMKRFRVLDQDMGAIGRMIRDLREGDSARKWRLFQ